MKALNITIKRSKYGFDNETILELDFSDYESLRGLTDDEIAREIKADKCNDRTTIDLYEEDGKYFAYYEWSDAEEEEEEEDEEIARLRHESYEQEIKNLRAWLDRQ